jgi:hypothetical protein
MTMAIDTCSDLSIITQDDYKTKFSSIQFLKTRQKIKTNGGQFLKLNGKIVVNPIIDGKQYSVLTLYIALVSVSQPPLLGCDWLQLVHINWPQFKQCIDNTKVFACAGTDKGSVFNELSHNSMVELIKTEYVELNSKEVG